jgi:hypothetical protein
MGLLSNNDPGYLPFKKEDLKKLTPSYLGGLFDGDGSFVICEINSGYQMLIHLAQSSPYILNLLKLKYPEGKIYKNTRIRN